ncbi:ABC transporter ATP-binding protein [Agrobacterium genomosp. 3 str. RTP8]|uniref:ABC transporter ATP-binding protein n=1 Tax=Agrobacterium tomkonis TaxID=1183410 RepID=UPI001CDA2E44|nr:ABC transporter ATP-binding protein [Agrobacterium tomkonis RTP8]
MLEVSNLTVAYGGNVAVNALSLKANGGRVTAVLGSNGAGKTTLLKCISGVVKPVSGNIQLMGESIVGLSTGEIVRRGISLVPEGRELFPRMSVYDNLLSGSHLRKDREGIRRDLDRVYGYFPVLSQKSKLAARNLSGGEQQMIAFGRALMAAPRVLLLDEPSIGLAPLVEQQLMQALRRLADDAGIAVVLVEQNASLALSVSDEGYVLELGCNALHGTADALLSDQGMRKAYLGI